MWIRIIETKRRFYDEEGDELSGYCFMPNPRRMFIQIAKRFNRFINDYAATVLHEMLHAWINMLQLKGFQIADDAEEKFVAEMEQVVLRRFLKKFGRRKRT